MPDGVTKLCKDAFFHVHSMKELVIPEGVTKLERDAVDPAAERLQGYLRAEQEAFQREPLFRQLLPALDLLPREGDEIA